MTSKIEQLRAETRELRKQAAKTHAWIPSGEDDDCDVCGASRDDHKPTNTPAPTTGVHTATGWKVEAWEVKPSVGFYVVVDPDGVNMAQSKSRHVAAQIASEHNSHDKLVAALRAFEQGFADGSIKWAKPRQADSDPYHPANVLMCAALRAAEGGE